MSNTKKNDFNNILKAIPWQLRLLTFDSLHKAGSGHVGPCLSMAEILSCLFFKVMNIDRNDESRDRFILSKGHGVPILYSVFHVLDWIDKNELESLRQVDTRLQGHPDKVALDLLDSGSGALGQGISISIGYAIAQSMRKTNSYSYCIVGDGEMQEGQIWEAILFAGVKRIQNLCVIVDNNKFQNEKSVQDTLGNISLESKLKSFGWDYISVDGHSLEELTEAFKYFKSSRFPTLIDAHTIKGKGVDFMENNNSWHSKVLNDGDYQKARQQCLDKLNDIN
ncbi:MAG: transketolase [Flavobacteriales bacterium]|nr:transketolase [Flavobacteriales bacterium]